MPILWLRSCICLLTALADVWSLMGKVTHTMLLLEFLSFFDCLICCLELHFFTIVFDPSRFDLMMFVKCQNFVFKKIFNMLLQNVLSQFFIVKCFTKPLLSYKLFWLKKWVNFVFLCGLLTTVLPKLPVAFSSLASVNRINALWTMQDHFIWRLIKAFNRSRQLANFAANFPNHPRPLQMLNFIWVVTVIA